MAVMKLTKRTIDRLSTEKRSGEKHYDTELRAFGIQIFPSGRKTFFVMCTISGRRKQITIGTYGIMTVDKARQKAKQVIGQVQAGEDPSSSSSDTGNELTFSKWVERYMEDVVQQKKHPREDRRYLGEAIKVFGDKLLTELNAEDIRNVFKSKRKHPTAANRWLASVRACLQAAWRLDLIPSNPAMKIRSMPEPAPRSRILTQDEYDRLIEALERLPEIHVRAAFYLLLETGARLSEVLHAKWEDIDFVSGSWRIPSTKSGRPQTIPLLDNVLELLRELPRESVFIIPGKIENQPRKDLKRPWKFLQEAVDIKDVTIHDLRRTFGKQVEQTSGLLQASRLLRHTDPRVTARHYAPFGIEEMRDALKRRKNREKS